MSAYKREAPPVDEKKIWPILCDILEMVWDRMKLVLFAYIASHIYGLSIYTQNGDHEGRNSHNFASFHLLSVDFEANYVS